MAAVIVLVEIMLYFVCVYYVIKKKKKCKFNSKTILRIRTDRFSRERFVRIKMKTCSVYLNTSIIYLLCIIHIGRDPCTNYHHFDNYAVIII